MKKRTLWLIALLTIGVLTLTGCNKDNTTTENPEEVEVANPAAVYCEENGGTLMPREDEKGEKLSLCVFNNGIACEEWDFYNGDCQSWEIAANNEATEEVVNEEVVEEVAPVVEEVAPVVEEEVATDETVTLDTENE